MDYPGIPGAGNGRPLIMARLPAMLKTTADAANPSFPPSREQRTRARTTGQSGKDGVSNAYAIYFQIKDRAGATMNGPTLSASIGCNIRGQNVPSH